MIIYKKIPEKPIPGFDVHDWSTVKFEMHSEIGVDDLVKEFKLFLLACGYGEELVNEYLPEQE